MQITNLPAEITEEVKKSEKKFQDQPASAVSLPAKTPQAPNLFSVKSANQWMEDASKRPAPIRLYDELWFENELCVLFADSNIGKSIFAVQIATEIAATRKVIYFDFELSDKQFEHRYSQDYRNHYVFPNHFFRAEINPDADFIGFDSFEEYLIHSMEQVIVNQGIKVLIIDNITYLKNETDKAKNALPLMKQLKALKSKYDLSLLVLAHTPKRDMTRPLTQNDLGGSKMIMNFCDSAFALGASQKDPSIRYLKQIKERNTPKIYGADNVKVFRIIKPENFLFMEFMVFTDEREHLKALTQEEKDNIDIRIKELHGKGMSQREIASMVGVSAGKVNKIVNS